MVLRRAAEDRVRDHPTVPRNDGARGRVEGVGDLRSGARGQETACPLLVPAVGEGESVTVLDQVLGLGGDEVVFDEVPRVPSVLVQAPDKGSGAPPGTGDVLHALTEGGRVPRRDAVGDGDEYGARGRSRFEQQRWDRPVRGGRGIAPLRPCSGQRRRLRALTSSNPLPASSGTASPSRSARAPHSGAANPWPPWKTRR